MMFKDLLNVIVGGNEDKPSGPSLDKILEPMDKKLDNFDDLILPAPESKPRTPFDSGLPREEMAIANMTLKQKMRVVLKMLPLMFNMQRAAKMYTGKFVPRKNKATLEFIEKLEQRAYEAGVKDIKYVKVPRTAIFKDKGIPHEYAIVFTVEMDKEPIDTSPSFESQLEVMRGYKNMAVIGNKLAKFMHKNGYAAYPGTALGGVTDYVHLGELAGLGAIGYHGLLITPDEGARLRINTIYTN